jgi:hypothetical protein
MVLSTAAFRLSSVIEAAMEIAGLGAAMKRLQVHADMVPLPTKAQSGTFCP